MRQSPKTLLNEAQMLVAQLLVEVAVWAAPRDEEGIRLVAAIGAWAGKESRTADKDYKAILAAYHFKDPLGHSLERCTDYLDLLAELEKLRAESAANQIVLHENDERPA